MQAFSPRIKTVKLSKRQANMLRPCVFKTDVGWIFLGWVSIRRRVAGGCRCPPVGPNSGASFPQRRQAESLFRPVLPARPVAYRRALYFAGLNAANHSAGVCIDDFSVPTNPACRKPSAEVNSPHNMRSSGERRSIVRALALNGWRRIAAGHRYCGSCRVRAGQRAERPRGRYSHPQL